MWRSLAADPTLQGAETGSSADFGAARGASVRPVAKCIVPAPVVEYSFCEGRSLKRGGDEDPELGDISVPAMSVVPVDSRASSSRNVRSRDRNTTPPRRAPIVEEPDADSTSTPLVYSPQVPIPDPLRDMNAAAFVAGSALQRAH